MIQQPLKSEGLGGLAVSPAQRAKETLGKAGPLVALILIGVFLSFRTDAFLTADNLLNVVRQAACNTISVTALSLSA